MRVLQKIFYLFLLKTPSSGCNSPLFFRDFQGFDINPLKSNPLDHSFDIPRPRDSQLKFVDFIYLYDSISHFPQLPCSLAPMLPASHAFPTQLRVPPPVNSFFLIQKSPGDGDPKSTEHDSN